MQDKPYSISKKDLFDLFGRLSADYRVIVPYSKGERLQFDDFDPKKEDLIELGGIRQSQPLKSFLNQPREKVFDGEKKAAKPLMVAGVKACDLSSLQLQDYVFLSGDVEDPFYAEKRKNTLLIACDCTYAKETCFCTAMEGAPYPRKDFDIGLSAVDNYFLVEVGSEKGQNMINSFKMFFKAPSHHSAGIRAANRDRVSKQIQGFVDRRGTPSTSQVRGTVRKNYNAIEFWQDIASTCVECGCCNLVCPTCHCFLLSDEKAPQGGQRFKSWDACLYNTFAKVAGGHNPRRHLYERMRNRFDKKFDFFPQVLGYFACTGCGRCIEGCPGDIDIREVLKGLVLGKWNSPPHD
jgi:ferredoxin